MVHMPQRSSLKPSFKKVLITELIIGFLLLLYTCKVRSMETNQPQLVTAMGVNIQMNKTPPTQGKNVILQQQTEGWRCFTEMFLRWEAPDSFSGSVSSPGISLAGLDNSSYGVMLDCSSAGWYPEPDVFWLDGEGNIMSAGPTDKVRGSDGLYRVSSRVTVEKRHNNNVTCRVQQKDINQT
ncbi:butyrophilin subfamily 2 member A2-like [Girardinichthys multiradiatus]|uniref:butyrophilin subfamily 2 member A2-like n=1 Tax=Girardinichthys multiradiatus TaxID=208333 RepID=UPI001FAC10C9|nr:butyrophilin subfamily 2 member A2-like [Girardinichthys multiradiatus]XP_047242665.1 butyrophilin subfamily 2 member A2-like [Girardinichthys multiradiatus]